LREVDPHAIDVKRNQIDPGDPAFGHGHDEQQLLVVSQLRVDVVVVDQVSRVEQDDLSLVESGLPCRTG
jgi:hypothetical protein